MDRGDVLGFVLRGLEEALDLERELGTRSVEFDRKILGVPSGSASAERLRSPVAPLKPAARPAPVRDSASARPAAAQGVARELVFLHDRPLSPKGGEMVANIIKALGRTAADTPVLVAPPVPRAKVLVVLGGRAMRSFFPEMRGEPGQWMKSSQGDDVLITYSPEYILRFGAVTPAVQKLKKEMWRSLKAVAQRLNAQDGRVLSTGKEITS